MISTPLEQNLQKEVLEYLRSRKDVYVVRIQANGSGNKGQPDIIVCHYGQFIGIELKRDIDGAYQVTKPQEIRGRQINAAGGIWKAVDSIADVEQVLELARVIFMNLPVNMEEL